MVLLGEEAQMEARFALFGDSGNLRQDRSTVCIVIEYFWKSIWTHPMELVDDVCHMESRFGHFGDSVSFGAR